MDELFRRLTLYASTPLPNEPDKKHYYVLLTDPVKSQSMGSNLVAWVSWESYLDDPTADKSCILDVGDHSSIRHKSRVNYSFADVVPVQSIESGIRKGTIVRLDELVSEEVYIKILRGLYASEITKARVETFCRTHVPIDISSQLSRKPPAID
jgi:prepilin-type processing-associated H-X9-DG protein